MAYTEDEYFDLDGIQRDEQLRRENAEALLDGLEATGKERGFDVESIIKLGIPTREILEVAEDAGIDQITMGSRGRSGVGRVLFGSVAQTVTRRSRVPVMIVR